MNLNRIVLLFCMYSLYSCTNNYDDKVVPDRKINNEDRSLLSLNFDSSDSVFLISHKSTLKIKRDTPIDYESVQLFENGNLNKEIIKESIKINDYNELVKILDSKITDSIFKPYNCFMPHHAILVYFKNRIDYLHICFLCKTYETPENSIFSKIVIDNKIFDLLDSFFKKNGIKYFPKLDE